MNEDKLQVAEHGHDEDIYPLSRREFLQSLGSGIVIFFAVGQVPTARGQSRGKKERPDFNAYLRIGEDGRVTCFTGKVELGQGPITSLAQTLADELDVPLESVDMVMGDTDLCPFDAGTWGSMTTPYFGPVLRAAGAEARAILIGLAAVRLKVPKDRLAVKDGVVFDKTNKSQKVTYAQLTEGKKIQKRLEQEPQIKTVGQYNLIGKPVNRLDARKKVTGEAKYTGDIRIAGMVCAKILRPPYHGAKVKSLDTSIVDKIEGAQVVRDGELIAVLHKYPDIAEKALGSLQVEYDIPKARFDDKTVFDYFVDNAGNSKVTAQGGNIESGQKLAKYMVEETYLNGYVSHAPMEPHAALAHFEDNKLTVWASTQTPFGLRRDLTRELGMSEENVRVITPFVGGGFGGKISNGQAMQAVKLAKIAKKPVQLVWTREDEFFYDTFRPAAVVKIKSGIADSGKIVSWNYDIYGMGSRGSQLFYDVPNHRTTVCRELKNGENMHTVATGPWRAPDNNTNSFARESHIDVMAARAKIDPLEFRLKNITDERFRRVLKAGADKFGWTPANKTPSGRGYGMACGFDVNVPVVLFAEVKVDERTGSIEVKRVVCAQDLGLVINPEGATIQVEGCITMGLGYALTEEVHFQGGDVIDMNFDSYELPRFSWVPKIETVLIEADESPSRGGGEPAIICMGGVLTNAVYDATGARLFQIPMTPERVRKAIASRA
ncbi:MAG: xanthine dehydrogenase family protein molybdopterin-binding subunit [Planctomycetes bacterium]|nr:xanthine dehydrogenase family protein molybdopterin-binding subunit [Planctomycetota bacterium]MBL7143127.1 xanthine dehydrogenase family protein molybdopterin-binding subunit [Phycisphaerae bacterium]